MWDLLSTNLREFSKVLGTTNGPLGSRSRHLESVSRTSTDVHQRPDLLAGRSAASTNVHQRPPTSTNVLSRLYSWLDYWLDQGSFHCQVTIRIRGADSEESELRPWEE